MINSNLNIFALPRNIKELNFQRILMKKNIDDNIIETLSDVSTEENFKSYAFRLSINEEKQTITLRGINFNRLFDRMNAIYEEKHLHHIFIKEYTAASLKKFKKKKINRSQMTIKNITIPKFFMLEVYCIFNDLYDTFNVGYYKTIQKTILDKTWVGKVFSEVKDMSVNVSNLKNLRYTLKDYQYEFVKSYKTLKDRYDLDGYLLSFDQGLGKTLTAIALSECLNKKRIVIVCPNSLKENWSYEIKQYFEKYDDTDKWKEDVYIVGHKNYTFGPKTKYIIVNMESVDKAFPYIKGNKDTMIVVDEMHYFRNMNGKRTGSLLKLKELCNCNDNLLMSGTPIKAVPNEIIPSLLMIDPMFTLDVAKLYFKAFNTDSTGTKNIVNSRYGMVMHRRTKDQVLQLPKKNILKLPLKISDPNRYLVKTVKEEINELFSELYEERISRIEDLRETYLSYVYRYTSSSEVELKRYVAYVNNKIEKEDEQYHELDLEWFNSYPKKYIIPNINNSESLRNFNKIYNIYMNLRRSCMGKAIGAILPKRRAEMFIDIFEGNKDYIGEAIINNPRKTVIFSSLLPVIHHIADSLAEMGIKNVRIVGGTPDRMKLIEEFKYGDDCDVLLATTQTLSTGVTLTEANQMFFFGTPWRSADFEQACDRIHRIGQTEEVYINSILLDTGDAKNLSTRMDDILNWSGDMFDSMVNNDENHYKAEGFALYDINI